MRTPADRARRLLRWYPRKWRDRYGAEFAALLEQSLTDEPRSFARTAELAAAGSRARLEEWDVLARARRPVDKAATGAALVLAGLIGMIVSAASTVVISNAAISRVPFQMPLVPASVPPHSRSAWYFAHSFGHSMGQMLIALSFLRFVELAALAGIAGAAFLVPIGVAVPRGLRLRRVGRMIALVAFTVLATYLAWGPAGAGYGAAWVLPEPAIVLVGFALAARFVRGAPISARVAGVAAVFSGVLAIGAGAGAVSAVGWFWGSFLHGGLATYWQVSGGTRAELGISVLLIVLSALLVVVGAARTLFRGSDLTSPSAALVAT